MTQSCSVHQTNPCAVVDLGRVEIELPVVARHRMLVVVVVVVVAERLGRLEREAVHAGVVLLDLEYALVVRVVQVDDAEEGEVDRHTNRRRHRIEPVRIGHAHAMHLRNYIRI